MQKLHLEPPAEPLGGAMNSADFAAVPMPPVVSRVCTFAPGTLPELRWATIIAHRDRSSPGDHICSRELRATAAAVRWAVSYPSIINRKLLILGDSLTALSAISKGRSSSFALNSILRPLMALLLASGLSLHLLYVPSANNPADYPSRNPRSSWRHDDEL